MSFRNVIKITLFSCGLLLVSSVHSEPLKLAGPDDPVAAPYRGLIYSADDIKAVRQALSSSDTDKKAQAERFLKSAQWWIDRGRAGIDALLPPDGAVFAFGFAGDPKNGRSWPRYGRSDDVCSLERPGEVKSPYTGDIYGIQKRGKMYYDDGNGWVDPKTGTRYYFKGMWNCYAIWKMHEALDDIAIAYMLTGDERCADIGLYMLDQIAAWRRRNPQNYGLIDYVRPSISPDQGFFGFMGNIANDRMIFSALSFDLLAGSKAAQRPSTGTKGVTVAQNIQQNYFSIFESNTLRELNSFQNHAVATFGAMLSEALLFGDAEHTRLGIDLGYAFLDSCINRDGDYYEVSGNYAQLGRRYGGLIISLLSNYRVERYSSEKHMPNQADYPYALQFGNNPVWYTTAVEMLYRHTVLGRHLQYGDGHSDRFMQPGGIDPNLVRDRATYISLLYRQTTRPDWKQSLSARYWNLPDVKNVELKTSDIIRFGPALWVEPPRPEQAVAEIVEESSDVMPAKGLAIIRSGKGVNQRAFYMRGGAANSHAHDDQMDFVPYGDGMSLAGEYGYFYYGTPDFWGWGTRSISHNMAVVNEDLPQPPFIHIAPWKRVPPADFKAVVRRKPAQLAEMANPGMWSGVADDMQDYRRTDWLIDISSNEFYFVDIFQIIGGRIHDYARHSPYLVPRKDDDGFSVSGVSLEPKDGVWVLAALDNPQLRDATYNQPGQAWGERLMGSSGRIKDMGIPGEQIGYSGWVPPQGNGYGFIYDIRSAQTSNDWNAQWLLPDETHVQCMHVLNYDGMTAISGHEPVLDDSCRQTSAIARRTLPDGATGPLHSRFATVTEVGLPDQLALSHVQRVKTTGTVPEQDRVALTVESRSGTFDTVLVNRQNGQVQTENGVELDGCRAFVRKDALGAVSDMLLQEGTLLKAGGITLESASPAWDAEVTDVSFDQDSFSITVNRLLPDDGRLKGAMVLFNCPADSDLPYSHNTYYEIEQVRNEGENSRLVFTQQRPAMAHVEVSAVNAAENMIETRFPLELVSLPQMDYFKGRRAVVVSDRIKPVSSRVVEFKDKKSFVVEDASGFKAGDRVAILAVQEGDRMRIPLQATLNRNASGQYELRSTHDVTVTLPEGAILLKK